MLVLAQDLVREILWINYLHSRRVKRQLERRATEMSAARLTGTLPYHTITNVTTCTVSVTLPYHSSTKVLLQIHCLPCLSSKGPYNTPYMKFSTGLASRVETPEANEDEEGLGEPSEVAKFLNELGEGDNRCLPACLLSKSQTLVMIPLMHP